MDKKILIADDDQNIRFLYEQELLDEGCQTVLAQDGKECLEKVKKELPDLVLLDINMPKMDGLEAIWRVIELNRNLPIIINSGYSSYRDNYMSWAADAYLIKSNNLEELKFSIKKVLEIHSTNN